MRISALLLSLNLVAVSVTAANWHVLEGGSGDGTSWSSPFGTLAAAETAASRGDIIYVGDGSYAGATFNTAESGTTTITVRKATEGEHGSATGWSSAYGDGVASITSALWIYSGYWTFDGVTGGGPDSWTSGHGFEMTYNAALTADWYIYMREAPGTTISHFNIGSAAQDDAGYDIAIYVAGTYRANDVTLDHCYIHHMGNQGMNLDGDGWTVEYNRMDYLGGYELGGNHGNGIEIREGNDMTFRWNKVSNWEASGFMGVYGSPTNAIASGHAYYGNIYYISDAGVEEGDIIYATGTESDIISDSVIYNNTFYGLSVGFIVDWDHSSNSGNQFKNNIFYSTTGTFSTVGMTFDYNASEDALGSDSNLQTLSSDPFTSAATADFSLASATTAGVTLSSPYNVDMLGNTRGADGTWDRGALEYTGTDITPPAFSSASIATDGTTLTVVFGEATVVGSGGSGGMTISVDGGGSQTATYSSGSGTTSLVYTVPTVYSGETVTVSYTNPGDGLEDAAGNDVATISAESVTNSSTQTEAPAASGAGTIRAETITIGAY